MFQLTKEFIINDASKFKNTTADVLVGDHICSLKSADIKHVYKRAGRAEQIEQLTITPTAATGSIAVGDIIRITFTVGLENRVHPLYNDAYPEHTQKFFYEAAATAVDTIPVKDLVAAMAEERTRFGNAYYTVNTANTTAFEITLADCYARIINFSVDKVGIPVGNSGAVAATLTGYQDVVNIYKLADRQAIVAAHTAGTVTGKLGDAGCCTTNEIIQNMRLLSDANINPYGVNKDERPLPKSVYTQYTFEQITERRHIGHQVFGSIDHSLTTWIFLVHEDEVSDFESNIAAFKYNKEGTLTPLDSTEMSNIEVADPTEF